MTQTATRLFVVAGMAAVIAIGTYAVRGSMKPREVDMPKKDFHTMPMQFGSWQGKVEHMPPAISGAEGAAVVEERSYRDGPRTIALHTAVFDNPDTGIYHSPMNCYRSQGWLKVKDTTMDLDVGGPQPVTVSYTTWEKEGQRVFVLYWFKLGEHFLFNRFEMGGVRWKMRGEKTWPALIKVLMQANSTDDAVGDEKALRGFAAEVYKWIHAPEAGAEAAPPADPADAADSPGV